MESNGSRYGALHLHILGSGSKGNCALVEGPQGLIMIDDGFSRREVLKRMHELGLSEHDVRALLLTHDRIADAAVVGIYREDDGEEIPKAFVVVQDGAELTEQEVMDFVAERVAPYKKIRAVEFIPQVPKSATGKILRRELRG